MGFDVDKFVASVTEDKRCDLCSWVLDNPIRTPCGHVFCSGCILPSVIRHGECPKLCRALTARDLENVLPLRESILNMHVHCEYQERGCNEIVRLTDLEVHCQDCVYRPMRCCNDSCETVVSFKDLHQHQIQDCPFRPSGVCESGCGLVLLHNTRYKHNCLPALRAHIAGQENKLNTLESEMKRAVSKFAKRERSLMVNIATLHRELYIQTIKFQKLIQECNNLEENISISRSQVSL